MNEQDIAEYLRGDEFRRWLTAPRAPSARPANYNPKDAKVPFVPVAVLDAALAKTIGAHDRILRLTAHIADKQYWQHGPGLRTARDRRRRGTPIEWYSDIPAILARATRQNQTDSRWAFWDEKTRRLLVIDLDERRNPVVISYHGRRNAPEWTR